MARGLELKKTRALDLITKVYFEHSLWGAPKVHKEVFARLHDENDLYYEPYLDDPNWPRENTVYQHLKKIREKDEARSSESKELDRLWSVVALAYYDIPPEATADLLDVWKYCLAIGHTFTIREAKWVARIRTAIQTSQNVYRYRGALLFGYANEYAIRERISEILGSPMDTRDIDGNLCFQERDWDWIVFRAIGMIPRLTTNYYNKELSEYNLFHIYINAASYVAEQNMPEVDLNRITGLASELSEKQAYMFAALLSYLSKGPSWKELSRSGEYLSILDYLTDLVMKELVDDLEESFFTKGIYETLDVSHWHDRPNGLAPEDVLSPDLLKLVGYEVATHTQTVDKPFPRLKNYPERTRYKAVFTLNRNKQEGGNQ